ncbi:MAG: DNA-processing protein DprA [Gammaproteobacteria bacterium]|nr:DNA-processing protein DprA [Gammaproteobacteria bacterium]
MESEPADWLALNRLPALHRSALGALAERRASPAELLDRRQRIDWRAVESDLAWLEGPHRHLLTLASDAYPPRLREISDAPPVLFVEGDAATPAAPQIAIVGSRRATPGGVETAFALAEALAARGLVITSGLALGVDAAGHRGALAAGGRTLAVAGNGLDTVYPRRHRCLAHRIVEHGAMVSEFPPGTPPLAGNFPRRNRLISGLGFGVVVVEAALRSGSLITARLAGEQGREVFAVPGAIRNPLAGGCHVLLRQGAKLVERASDILEELPEGPWQRAEGTPRPAPEPAFELPQQEERVLARIDYHATSFDSLVERSGLTAETLCSILLALEIRGLIAPVPGGAYCRVGNRRASPGSPGC